MLALYPRLAAWYDRVAAFGHGRPVALDSGEAIAIAAAAGGHAPAAVAEGSGFAAGDEVTVCATDYGSDPVEGRLAGLDAGEVVIARDDPRAGRVHVHFPRIGYQLKPAPRKDTP